MNSNEYIRKGLHKLLKQYPQLTFFYQFDKKSNLHQILVEPINEFESNKSFKNDEADFIFDFDNLFFPESIVFISENSLIKIESPEFIFKSYPIDLEYNMQFKCQGIKDQGYLSGENNYALAA